jgi:hypothetical protein
MKNYIDYYFINKNEDTALIKLIFISDFLS